MTLYHASRGFWAEQLLIELGAPVNDHTMLGILAWFAGENTKARNNPLATTRKHPRSTNFNSAGVKNYASFAVGMQATLETIRLAPYANLRAVIMRGTSGHDIARAVVASPWGTKHVPIDGIIPASSARRAVAS